MRLWAGWLLVPSGSWFSWHLWFLSSLLSANFTLLLYCVTASALDIQYEKWIDYGCSRVVCWGGMWVDGSGLGWGLGVASQWWLAYAEFAYSNKCAVQFLIIDVCMHTVVDTVIWEMHLCCELLAWLVVSPPCFDCFSFDMSPGLSLTLGLRI